jgi:ribA/ribD-fused uncharacterized protein
MNKTETNRIYHKYACAVFSKTNEKFGELSNMAPGFALFINDNILPNTEALYQAMRYPLFPDIQHEIISQNSPMTAKMISKKYRDKTRQDWDLVKVRIMRWCLEVKLCQNYRTFNSVLEETEDKPIVEYSAKDAFWGAMPAEPDKLVGRNALGRLLMELRENYTKMSSKPERVEPANVTGFLLYGHEIKTIFSEKVYATNIEEVPADSGVYLK